MFGIITCLTCSEMPIDTDSESDWEINPHPRTELKKSYRDKYRSIAMPPFKVLYAGFNSKGAVVMGREMNPKNEIILLHTPNPKNDFKKINFDYLKAREEIDCVIEDRSLWVLDGNSSAPVFDKIVKKRTKHIIRIGMQNLEKNVTFLCPSHLIEAREIQNTNNDFKLNKKKCIPFPIGEVLFTIPKIYSRNFLDCSIHFV